MNWRDRRGYSALFWAVTFGLVVIPLLAYSMEAGRLGRAASEVQKAADAAALAAAREVDVQRWREQGLFEFMPDAQAVAQQYASANANYLTSRRIHVAVIGIGIDQDTQTVTVDCVANVQPLFPAGFPGAGAIHKTGMAQVNWR